MMEVYLVEYGSPTHGDHLAVFKNYELADEFYDTWLEIMAKSPQQHIYVRFPEQLNVAYSLGAFEGRVKKDDRLGRMFAKHRAAKEVAI